MKRRAVAGTALAALLVLAGAPAHAASVTTVVQGDVVRIVSELDASASHMIVGVPATWDVQVSASRPDGVIAVSLTGTATPDAYAITVRRCAVAWTASG